MDKSVGMTYITTDSGETNSDAHESVYIYFILFSGTNVQYEHLWMLYAAPEWKMYNQNRFFCDCKFIKSLLPLTTQA